MLFLSNLGYASSTARSRIRVKISNRVLRAIGWTACASQQGVTQFRLGSHKCDAAGAACASQVNTQGHGIRQVHCFKIKHVFIVPSRNLSSESNPALPYPPLLPQPESEAALPPPPLHSGLTPPRPTPTPPSYRRPSTARGSASWTVATFVTPHRWSCAPHPTPAPSPPTSVSGPTHLLAEARACCDIDEPLDSLVPHAAGEGAGSCADLEGGREGARRPRGQAGQGAD